MKLTTEKMQEIVDDVNNTISFNSSIEVRRALEEVAKRHDVSMLLVAVLMVADETGGK